VGHSAPHETTVVGRYAIFGEIAAGGMATVHYGRLLGPIGFSRTVAIKRLHAQFARDADFVAMFLDEARLAARIQHPNVVPTLDVVATESELFLVMEYVQGETLARLVRTMRERGERIPPAVASCIVAQALHGLHAAHEAKDEKGQPLGVVHRDVSPQNVLVGVDGVVRVLDFGVAKAAVRLQTTSQGQLKGKLAYMAPEQIGGRVDRLTDVYAAGVVLWEALTSHRLYEAENEAQLMHMVLRGKPQAPSKVVPDLPPALDEIVLRALSLDRTKRFPTAREMALALERGPGIAMTSEVGEWVERVASERLTQHNERIAEIESNARGKAPQDADVVSRLRSMAEATGKAPPNRPAPAPAPSEPPEPTVTTNPPLEASGERRAVNTVPPKREPESAPKRDAPPPPTEGSADVHPARRPLSERGRNLDGTPPPLSERGRNLDLDSAAYRRDQDTPSRREPNARRRILVIDDSVVMLDRIRIRLEAEGYDVVTTTNAVGNARHIRTCDLVIIDFHMPGIDGATVIQSLKSAATAGGHSCRFYLYTSDPVIAKDHKRLGFDGVFTDKGDEQSLARQVRAVFRMLQMRALRKVKP
jgi:serine/threonine-protein kinase